MLYIFCLHYDILHITYTLNFPLLNLFKLISYQFTSDHQNVSISFIMSNTLNSDVLDNYGGVLPNSFKNMQGIFCDSDNSDNPLNFLKNSNYHDLDMLRNELVKKSDNFNVLSINIQSLTTSFDQLHSTVDFLKRNNVHLSALCIQDIHLMP